MISVRFQGKPFNITVIQVYAMNSKKRQKDRMLEVKFPRSVDAQYVTGEEWRNNSRKNQEMGPQQKQ